MTTGEEIVARAIHHAEAGMTSDEAVEDLLVCCSGRRVAVVRARQDLLNRAEADPSDQAVATALGFVDDVLAQDVWDVA